jgi:predicted acylesterase/phospholipase RssA
VLLKERFARLRPLEELELGVVRASLEDPELMTPEEEGALRFAISLARLYRVRHQGRDLGVGASLDPFREELTARLAPLFNGTRPPPEREDLAPHLHRLKEEALYARDTLLRRHKDRLPAEAVDHEIRHKSLVLVTGGGGGTAYLYVGAMALLEEYGLKPSLLVGASMGAILALFRARMKTFDSAEVVNIVRQLSWKKLFRAVSLESRYGIPAALRLFLRSGIGRYFDAAPETGHAGLRLRDLEIPTLISIAGIRKGMLPHPLEFYEKLFQRGPKLLLDPRQLSRTVTSAMGALAELFTRPEIMATLHLGLEGDSRDFDAVDAAGFSCGLPGVIHYDVLREDPRMHALLGDLMGSHGVSRFADGGLVDNLPAKAAWRAVHKGKIGTRNAFIFALNGFAPKLSTPLWLPLQRLAAMNVSKNRPYAHWVKDFKKTLSALDVVPSVEQFTQAITWGRTQLAPDMPLLSRMLKPLPPLES